MPAHDIIVIGGSAGAVEAVARLAGALPSDLPAAVFIVIHFSPSAVSVLPRILSRAGPLPARHPDDGEEIRRGHIYVAPPDCHMTIEAGRVRVGSGPRENRHRPAIDPLFRSAALAYGPRVAGVILSGNLADGAAGLRRVAAQGGVTIVQDPDDALYGGMPSSAIAYVQVDHVLPLDEIAGVLAREAGQTFEKDVAMTNGNQAPLPPAGVEQTVVLEDRAHNPGTPSTMTCPECHGTLWETNDDALTQFRCRIGHAYNADALVAHQAEVLEAALWTALRSLEEHAALNRRMGAKALDQGRAHSAASFTEHAVEAEHHASILRRVLDRDARNLVAELST